ncbi:MAG TPA: hypothetical protein PKO06_15335, partial [Candidatus Ozemobacteraceae bacterium]|nr:hypothetical protein [Candidatus Ozemobacteraceae bacterium]
MNKLFTTTLRPSTVLRVLVLAVGLLFSSVGLAQPTASEPDELVILNSYHYGYRWSDGEARGVYEELIAAFPRAQVFHEFLGTKHVPYVESNRAYFDLLAEQLRAKFRSGGTDLIVALDNDALAFLNHYAEKIWPRVPVVFCGV